MLLLTITYALLSVISWSAFAYKLRDLIRDWRNRELQILCLSIATFAAPFVLASPAVYEGIDRVLGVPNIATLIIYMSVCICTTGWVALLMTWSSAQDKVRLRHRLLVGYSVATLIVMMVYFFLGNAGSVEHPIDFDVRFEAVPYISVFLLSYQLQFTVSKVLLVVLCHRYAKVVADRVWLNRGLRTVMVGAVFGLGYSVPKIVNMVWDLVGKSPLHTVSSLVAPMSASVCAALFSVGFTMPAWGAGVARVRELSSVYRRYQRIYPLWKDVTDHLPGIVLFPVTPRTTHWSLSNLWRLVGRQVIEVRDGKLAVRPKGDPEVEYTLHDIELLLGRQITEIRDAQWQLRLSFTEQTAEIARELAAEHGLIGEPADAIIEAAQLAIALKARAAGVDVPGEEESPLLDLAEGDDDVEAAWLIKVADAYRTSPVIALALARTVHAETVSTGIGA
ncbi:hypothetical protein ABIA32_006338 [Streptacidiphilus sp. MAP12-20]|uniref:MAB_1171c family putative transporter n=1 Tax=Streptacidiphilus sp. MAP12-20 TaxID=3156299 RepID=UPI0035168060